MSKPCKLKVLVTGANGFVGRTMCEQLLVRGYAVRGAVRNQVHSVEIETTPVGAIDGLTDWGKVLNGIDVVIHLAARVHVMHDDAPDPLKEFRRVNTEGVAHLARVAAAMGVKRLVYVSTIKVNGETTYGNRRFTEDDVPAPQDPYAISKWEAEQALHRAAMETGLEVVIVRPPLVYGHEVKGNFSRMLKALSKGMPLPLASMTNLRSLIYVENLVDALIACATHPSAAGKTYLVSDGEDVSTSDLLHQLGRAQGCHARLFPCPPILLKLAARIIGKTDQVERLLGSLRVDSGKIRRELNWSPKYTLQEGLKITGASFRISNKQE